MIVHMARVGQILRRIALELDGSLGLKHAQSPSASRPPPAAEKSSSRPTRPCSERTPSSIRTETGLRTYYSRLSRSADRPSPAHRRIPAHIRDYRTQTR